MKGADIRTIVSRLAEPSGLSYRLDRAVQGKMTFRFEEVDPVEALDILNEMNGVSVRCDGGVLVIGIAGDDSTKVEASFSTSHFPESQSAAHLRILGGPDSAVKLASDGLIHAVGTDADILRMGIVSRLLDEFAQPE